MNVDNDKDVQDSFHTQVDRVDGDLVYGDVVHGNQTKIIAERDINITITVEEAAKAGVILPKKLAGWDGRIPYLGLRSFRDRKEDAKFYFGREDLTKRLLDRVEQGNFVAVVGASGSGKSSVVRAGLIYGLQSRRLVSQKRWKIIDLRPGGDPVKRLGDAIGRATGSFELGAKLEKRIGHKDGEGALADTINRILPNGPDERCIIFIDQFEELFVQTNDEKKRSQFIDQLLVAANERTVVVLAMRIDFLGDVTKYSSLRNRFNDHMELVGEMSAVDLKRAIALPALAVGVNIEQQLIKAVMDDMRGEPGALAMMSFVLRDLFDSQARQRGDGIVLTKEAYIDRGGILSALEKHANEIFETHLREDEALVAHLFSNLVHISDSRVVTRKRASIRNLAANEEDRQKLEKIIQVLSRDGVRLLSVSGPEGQGLESVPQNGDRIVEISHEKLIDAWSWLNELIETNRELIRLMNRVHHDAEIWNRTKETEYLWRGGQLAQITEAPPRFFEMVDEQSRKFVKASFKWQAEQKREEERRQQRELTLERERFKNVQRAQRLQLVVMIFLLGLGMITVGEITRQGLFKRQARMLLTADSTIDKRFYWAFWGQESNLLSLPDEGIEIEVHEVTNWQYSRCVKAGSCQVPVNPIAYQSSKLWDHPVINVTAYQADTYCQWLGRRLPKSEEWEAASNSQFKIERDEAYAAQSTYPVVKPGDPLFPGPESIFGLDDNVREWTTSLFNPDSSVVQSGPMLEWNISGEEEYVEQQLLVRGGSYKGDFVNGITALVQSDYAENVGFRCYVDID